MVVVPNLKGREERLQYSVCYCLVPKPSHCSVFDSISCFKLDGGKAC